MSLADQERRRSGSSLLTPQHLLLGLILEGKGVAAHALQRLHPGIDVITTALAASIAADVAAQPPVEIVAATPPTAWGRIVRALRDWLPRKRPLASGTKCIIEHAMSEARALRHNYVGTEHLLLGLFDEPECTAAQLLYAHKLKADDVRLAVLDILRGTR